jgi:hypothetical protein
MAFTRLKAAIVCGTLAFGAAYQCNFPPPQRFLDSAQKHELEVYKIECEDRADKLAHVRHSPLPYFSSYTVCAERHYREKHLSDKKDNGQNQE